MNRLVNNRCLAPIRLSEYNGSNVLYVYISEILSNRSYLPRHPCGLAVLYLSVCVCVCVCVCVYIYIKTHLNSTKK